MKLDTAKIKKILAENEWSVKDCASRIGMSANQLASIIRRGTVMPKTAGRVAKALKCSLEDIVIL